MTTYTPIDIKAARAQYNCKAEIEKLLGPSRAGMYLCPFHEERTPSFHVYNDGFHCFGCNAHGDIFDFWSHWYKKSLGDILRDHRVDPLEEIRRKQEYQEREIKRLARQVENLEKNLAELRNSNLEISYYEKNPQLRQQAWEQRGVPEWYQSWTYLGFDPDHRFWIGEDYHTPTLTIPVYEPGTRDLLNIRHRLLNPCDKIGKYRPERSGLPASLFAANPDQGLTGKTVLVEGEIKAIVTWVTAGNDLQVVGSPSKNLSPSMFEKLQECNPIYYIPDPDVDRETIVKTARNFRDHDFYLVRLPSKVDDLILSAGLDSNWLQGLLDSARKL